MDTLVPVLQFVTPANSPPSVMSTVNAFNNPDGNVSCHPYYDPPLPPIPPSCLPPCRPGLRPDCTPDWMPDCTPDWMPDCNLGYRFF